MEYLCRDIREREFSNYQESISRNITVQYVVQGKAGFTNCHSRGRRLPAGNVVGRLHRKRQPRDGCAVLSEGYMGGLEARADLTLVDKTLFGQL